MLVKGAYDCYVKIHCLLLSHCSRNYVTGPKHLMLKRDHGVSEMKKTLRKRNTGFLANSNTIGYITLVVITGIIILVPYFWVNSCTPFGDRVPKDFICRCSRLKWVTETWRPQSTTRRAQSDICWVTCPIVKKEVRKCWKCVIPCSVDVGSHRHFQIFHTSCGLRWSMCAPCFFPVTVCFLCLC